MIYCNPAIMFGQPSLKGRRLTVFDIVTKLYFEENVPDALEDYEIDLREAKEATLYCLSLECRNDSNRLLFCEGCLLRKFDEGWNFDRSDFEERLIGNQKFVFSKDRKIIFFGSLDEFEDAESGKATWILAERVIQKLTVL